MALKITKINKGMTNLVLEPMIICINNSILCKSLFLPINKCCVNCS
uniref:Uncharacterized protein n=1 Tax=Arundo donax TaxID=35708 RepID=A0A0A9B312_ARUDO